MKLKVCGMKYPDNMTAVAALQPDYLGYIFYSKSSRYFDRSIPNFSDNIQKVGVFVDASEAYISNKINEYELNAIQLHGNETPEFCKELKNKLASESKSGAPSLIKVFSIKDTFDFNVLKAYEPYVDYFLFDTKGKLPGGNGYTFDWSVLKQYPSQKPYFLSGGIGLNEIDEVLSFLGREESKYCYAIDVNSKFEIAPGQKNIEQLKQFKDKLGDFLKSHQNENTKQ
ncbi:phosphoribosylanthranilate isomerase [Zhouia amylolytica]|uniref:N-(5'-phosphoribosyl)anthranilate isomerase n=1 Tax=Zhouia amylolytica AD3 TaxID=1286632 RepID=W2USC7_9FLAO|nr:phosphoribosylanthranilate isomerase [Zhouia amylolytica]ETN96903.1 phosphoribosylanthranilate isomerase [Zhouia amylolytica AD3]